MTKREKQLERELDAAGALCSAQWTKIKRHEKQIARLELRIDTLENKLKLAGLAGAET